MALLGPRQVGKTTLALEIGETCPSIYLDLESEADRAKLAEPELYLERYADHLVILDEVHRMPNIFQLFARSDRSRPPQQPENRPLSAAGLGLRVPGKIDPLSR